jgi:hypothetical protein
MGDRLLRVAMSIELAYIAERLAKLLEDLSKEFFVPVTEAAEKRGKKKERKQAIGGARIMAFSPPLGRHPVLQKALTDMKELLDSSRNFDEEELRLKAQSFLHVSRAFLFNLSSITESGVHEYLPMFHTFDELIQCCVQRGKPRGQVAQESKRSWANFLSAMDEVDRDAEGEKCEVVQERLRAQVKVLEISMAEMEEIFRSDADNFLGASDNLLEACKVCIFLRKPPN